MLDYPIKFHPILKEKIWGGNKLETILHKQVKGDSFGESWEISGVQGDISEVANGRLEGMSLTELLDKYCEKLVGKRIYKRFGNEFPLLIKFIDARTELSVQLHPGDKIARQRHNSFGKTEMWYIMQAEQGAKINIGFKENINRDHYIKALEAGEIIELLNFEEVEKGDSFFIKTGKVHAIGAGVLLAEIQQTSDVTYRIYDWNRLDKNGNSRELHTALAIDAIDFEKKDDFRLRYKTKTNEANRIAKCEYFTTNYFAVQGRIQADYSHLDSFVIYICISGTAIVSAGQNSESLDKGQTLLLPASVNGVKVNAEDCELLEVYID